MHHVYYPFAFSEGDTIKLVIVCQANFRQRQLNKLLTVDGKEIMYCEYNCQWIQSYENDSHHKNRF